MSKSNTCFTISDNFSIFTKVTRFILVAYIIWYGQWTPAAKNIIVNFVRNIGSTPWWRINYAYGGVGPLAYGGSADDANYSRGKYFANELAVWGVVQNAFNRNLLPKNPNGIYLVLSSR